MSTLENSQIEPTSMESDGTSRALLAALSTGALVGLLASADAQVSGNKLSAKALRNRLLRRITYGPAPEEVSQCAKLGYDAYVDYQLNFETIDDSECEQAASYFSTINFSERDLSKVRDDMAKEDLSDATIVRALLSKRQLYQRMVEFWTDHFNVFYDKVGVLKVVHDREVIRKYALGNFPQMLLANTMSPATLVYLDNDPSSKLAPNQNLAREMMELHSIGVNGGYTQSDVIAVAKCLTGWTVRLWPPYAPDIGKFYFDKYNHSGGSKIVLKQTIVSSGVLEGQKVCEILSKSRACGQFLGIKLCRFFLGYEPPVELVEQLADIYLTTGGEIKPMVKAVLSQANMTAAPLMVKRPFHYTIGLLRQTRARLVYVWPIREALSRMGQAPFDWAPPNGYPLSSGYWAPGLLERWNFAYQVLNRQMEWVTLDRAKLFKLGSTNAEVLAKINTVMYQGEMSEAAKNALIPLIGDDTEAYAHSLSVMGHAAAFPGYQEC